MTNSPRTSFQLGWRCVTYNDHRIMVFARDEIEGEPPSLVTLPTHEQSSEYRSQIAMAVVRLADIEETTPQDIVEKIQVGKYYLLE